MFKILSILFLILFIASCAAKSPVATTSSGLDKASVLRILKERAKDFCAYEGKVRVALSGTGGAQKAAGMLKMNCDGNAALSILGPFGIVLEEFTLKDGVFIVASEGTKRDISSSPYAYILQSALRIPPVTPKPDYRYEDLNGSYLFEGEGYRILVDDAFKIAGVETLSYKARYIYLKDAPESVAVTLPCSTSTCTLVTVEFLEEWK